MCGICGELRFDGSPVDPLVLEAMSDTLRHRGPDDAGVWVGESVGLAHRRLSILDLSRRARQPMWSASGESVIVFNGEIYNFAEVRRELKNHGCAFASDGDTEVIVNAVEQWGIERAVSRFIGMFAFAVWNLRVRTLWLCRDRAGVKPLYYHVSPTEVLFASELRALYRHPAFHKELSDVGLGQYFVFGYTAAETTVFKSAKRVLAGQILEIRSDGRISRRRYWQLNREGRGSYKGSLSEASEQLEALTEDAFRYRLVSDVPVAIFLSGGVDSSYLAAVLRRKLNAQLLHLTIGFREARVDEVAKAAAVARELGVEHVVRYLEEAQSLEALRRFVDTYDEPFSDTSGIPTALVSRVAREHVKVALTADGADEQFGGYTSYRDYARSYSASRTLPAWLRRSTAAFLAGAVPYRPMLAVLEVIAGAASHPRLIARYEKLIELLRADNAGDLVRLTGEKGWATRRVREIVPYATAQLLQDSAFIGSRDGHTEKALVDLMMSVDYQTFLRDDILTKMDRASMSVSLECREPFLDHRITEFVATLPIEYLWGPQETKRVLKRLLSKWLNPRLVAAPKQGFTIPLDEWLRGPWRPLVDEYLAPAAIRRVGILDEAVARAEVESFFRWRGSRSERVLMMLTFQMWAYRWYLHG